MTCAANFLIAHPNFQRRGRRRNEIELTYRANEFAECRVFKEPVDYQDSSKIPHDDPCRQPWRRPQPQQLICKKYERKKSYRNPLIAQLARPSKARMNPPAHGVAN